MRRFIVQAILGIINAGRIMICRHQASSMIAIVTTGLYSNMTGTEGIRTKAPVITARGLAAGDIYKRLGKYKAPGVNYLTLLKNESAITADYYLPLRTYISYE